jgi:hypothetical protein
LATSTTPAVTATPTPSTTVQATTVPTIAATTPVPAIIATPPLNYNFGMSVATTLLGLNDAQLNAELDDLVSLHIGWVRMDFDWSLIQPDTNVAYNWDNYDRVVHALNARNIKVLGILDYSTHWAISPTCGFITCPPQNNADFADFAADIAKHYGPQGLHTWEIWNEPNNRGFWKPGANVAGYVQLLEAAYPAIKAADPQAFVISGGLAPEATSNGNIAPVDFLSLMYALGAKNYFDAVGFHPYSFPAQPSYFAQWNAWQQMSATSPSVRSVMIANGDADKQVWLTEYGAPTDGPGVLAPSDNFFANGPDHVNEPVQTDIIAEGITLKEASPWTGPLFLYSYKDLGTSNSTVENFFGILRYDGSRKSSYLRLQQLIQ